MKIQKLIKKEELTKLIKDLKLSSKSIVFTNGCFDIVHAGHVDYMEKAKQMGDVLIVGLNSDSSIKNIKDSKRPIVSEKYRLKLLAGLSSIDYIVTFDEETPIKLIEEIKPDILVKGKDWEKKGVVGEDLVKSYGGRLELIELVPGISTSIIIDKIIESYGKN